MNGYKYKTIKARNISELRQKLAKCKQRGWELDGHVEIKPVEHNGAKIKMLMQGMIKYDHKDVMQKCEK